MGQAYIWYRFRENGDFSRKSPIFSTIRRSGKKEDDFFYLP